MDLYFSCGYGVRHFVENEMRFWDVTKILRTAYDTLLGFLVTLKYYFSPAITYQYPKEKKPVPERFRGILAFHPEICISCEMCVRVCPSDVISMAWERNEATKKKDLLWYQIDYAKCNVCRLCEEVCPTKIKSIHHTNEYEMVFEKRDDFIVKWGPSTEDTVTGGAAKQSWFPFTREAREDLKKKGKTPVAGKGTR